MAIVRVVARQEPWNQECLTLTGLSLSYSLGSLIVEFSCSSRLHCIVSSKGYLNIYATMQMQPMRHTCFLAVIASSIPKILRSTLPISLNKFMVRSKLY